MTAPGRRGAVLASTVSARLTAVLLGAACLAWTATPLVRTGLAQTALGLAVAAVVGGALNLASADIAMPEEQYYLTGWVPAWLMILAALRAVAWEETATVVILVLEVLHPARPWHTVALGAGLIAYLLAVHIAESGAQAAPLLRRHAAVLIAGACLLALTAGLVMIPAAAPGAGSAVLRVIAAVAVVVALLLALPG